MIRRTDERPVVATREMMRRKRRRRALASLGVVTVAVSGIGYMAWHHIDEQEYLLDERCELKVGEDEHRLSPTQTANAALLSATAAERGLPEAAAGHAISIALQETDLSVPETDDASEDATDEAGAGGAHRLFTRGSPNLGPGSSDVATTAEEFYDSVENVLDGDDEDGGGGADSADSDDGDDGDSDDGGPTHWSSELNAAETAELLDRPHDASFYAQYDQIGRAFAAPLTGQQPVGMTCHLSQLDVPGPDPVGVAEELAAALPQTLELPEPAEGDSSDTDSAEDDEGDGDSEEEQPTGPDYSEAIEVSGEAEDAAVVVEVPPRDAEGDDAGATGSEEVWMIAHWAVAHAERFGVQDVHAGHYSWDRDTARWDRTEEARDGTVALTFSR